MDFIFMVIFWFGLLYILSLAYVYDKVLYYKGAYLMLKEINGEQKKLIECMEKDRGD